MITATRTWNKARTKATITITFEDGRTQNVGGNRAARAACIIVAEHAAGESVGFYGARADLHAAEREAENLRTATSRSTRGRYGQPGEAWAVTPWNVAEVVAVTELEEAAR